MRPCQFLVGCFFLIFVTVATAQTTSTPADVHVKLSLADKKAVFRVGEEIRLVLEISADREDYRVEILPDSGTFGNDLVMVSPDTGITHWLDELQDNRPVPRHAYAMSDLTYVPAAVEIVLNDTLRFDVPGRYTANVATRRVSTRANGQAIPFVTNPVSFEIQPMSEADEQQEVKRLSDLLTTARDQTSVAQLTRQLAFLTGDPSTREKLRRFLSPDPQDHGSYMYAGLFIARSRLLVLKSLETALRDPSVPATASIVNAATRLKTMLTHGIREKPADGITWFLEAPENPLAAEIREAYVVELAAGLAKRTGESKTTTTLTILTFAKEALETDDVSQASNAAYLIGLHGLSGDEQVLEARLKRWREQWRDRVAEADAQSQGLIERELIRALINGKNWKLSNANELQRSCLTKLCKESILPY